MPRYEADAIERTAEKLSPASGVCPQCRREVLVEDGRHQEHTPDQADPGGAELIAAVRAGVAAWKASLVRMASRTSRCCVTCNTETEESPDAVWCESCGALPVLCLLPPGHCPLCAAAGSPDNEKVRTATDAAAEPRPGDVSVCWGCGQVGIYTDADPAIRLPTPDELAELATDPGLAAALAAHGFASERGAGPEAAVAIARQMTARNN